MTNRENFQAQLTQAYTALYAAEPAEYAMARARYTPAELAAKMTESLATGRGNREGKGIKAACKACGIKYTYSAIEAYLAA